MRKLLLLFLLAYCPFIYAMNCELITTRTETDGGVFSLASFKGDLYLGMFGYNYNESTVNDPMIWRYDGSTVAPMNLLKWQLGTSESICAMKEFKGYLYASTEESGKIFRSGNGSTWTNVYDGPHRDACDLETDGVTLLAPQTHGGVVLYTTTGTTWSVSTVTTSGVPYIRETIKFNNQWYAAGIRRTTGERFLYRTQDDSISNWAYIQSQPPGRIFRMSQHDGRLYASLAANPPYLTQDKIGLYSSIDGVSWIKNYLSSWNTYSHLNTLYKVSLDNNRNGFVATVSSGFKPRSSSTFGQGGGSGLIEFNEQGDYVQHLCNFPDEEYAEATIWHNGDLYIGTQRGGYHIADPNYAVGYGNLYKVSGLDQFNYSQSNPNINPIINLLLLDD